MQVKLSEAKMLDLVGPFTIKKPWSVKMTSLNSESIGECYHLGHAQRLAQAFRSRAEHDPGHDEKDSDHYGAGEGR